MLFILQIEQEFGLIVGKADIKSHFYCQWMTKYVPAIISYAENSSKRHVTNQLAILDQFSSTCMHILREY